MRCRQARRELALWVGGDHDPRLYPLLETHLASCPECRAFARKTKTALDPLKAVASGGGSDSHDHDSSGGTGWSLWPSVRARLSRRKVQFNDLLDTPVGWIPVTGLSVACMALFVVVFSTARFTPSQQQFATGFDAPMLQTPVSYQLDRKSVLDHSREKSRRVSSVRGFSHFQDANFAPGDEPQGSRQNREGPLLHFYMK